MISANVMRMNTQDARRELQSLAAQGLTILAFVCDGRAPSLADRNTLRRLASEARELLPEAGFPGEPIWRGLQRASIGTDTNFDSFDAAYWRDVIDELERGVELLATLDSARRVRDIDIHVVG